MTNLPLISIIIPCYNGAETIERAIESIIKQSYNNYEIIIVNDGSSDNSEEIITKLQKNISSIRYFNHGFNRGLSAARNTGIKQSKGSYIGFLDADDEWLKYKLEEQINYFKKSSYDSLGVVYSGLIFIEGSSFKSTWMPPHYPENFLKELLKVNIVLGGGSSCLFRKEVFEICGLFDESPPMRTKQDYEMWIRIAQNFRFGFVKKYLVKCYITEGISYEIAFSKPMKGIKAYIYILNKHKDLFSKFPQGLSNHLKFIGIQFLWASRPKFARSFLLKSIKINPRNFTSYFFLVISLLGRKIGKRISLDLHQKKLFG